MTDKISPEDFQRIYKVVEEKGGIVLAIVFVALLFGILFLSLWVGQISKNTKSIFKQRNRSTRFLGRNPNNSR